MNAQEWNFNDTKLWVVDHPDFQSLSHDERDEIAHSLVNLTAEAFLRFKVDQEITDDVVIHVRDHAQRFKGAYNENGEPVAYIVSMIKQHCGLPLYYLGGIICTHQFKHCGLTKAMLIEELVETKPHFLALQTQNGQMLGLMRKFCTIDRQLCVDAAITVNEKPRPHGIVSKGVYRDGKMALYDDIERFKAEGMELRREDLVELLGEEAANDFNWQRGDALFLAGHVR